MKFVGLDVHAYRKPIVDDCVCGSCSMNNCRYPDCSISTLIGMGRIVDDVVVKVPDHMFKPTHFSFGCALDKVRKT